MVYVCNIRVVFAFCAADGSNSETMGSQTKHTGKNFYDGLLVNIFGDSIRSCFMAKRIRV
jgi:hypothetical protein